MMRKKKCADGSFGGCSVLHQHRKRTFLWGEQVDKETAINKDRTAALSCKGCRPEYTPLLTPQESISLWNRPSLELCEHGYLCEERWNKMKKRQGHIVPLKSIKSQARKAQHVLSGFFKKECIEHWIHKLCGASKLLQINFSIHLWEKRELHHTQGTSSDQMMAVIISAIAELIGIGSKYSWPQKLFDHKLCGFRKMCKTPGAARLKPV